MEFYQISVGTLSLDSIVVDSPLHDLPILVRKRVGVFLVLLPSHKNEYRMFQTTRVTHNYSKYIFILL